DRGAVEVGIAVCPAPEDVPLSLVAVAERGLHLDLDPRPGRRLRVPRRDELVPWERKRRQAGRPGAVLVGPGAVGRVPRVVGERIRVVEGAEAARSKLERGAGQDGAVTRRVGRVQREVLEIDVVRVRCTCGGRADEPEGCGRYGDEQSTSHASDPTKIAAKLQPRRRLRRRPQEARALPGRPPELTGRSD